MKKLFLILLVLPLFALAQADYYNTPFPSEKNTATDNGVDKNQETNGKSTDPTSGAAATAAGLNASSTCEACNMNRLNLENKNTSATPGAPKANENSSSGTVKSGQ